MKIKLLFIFFTFFFINKEICAQIKLAPNSPAKSEKENAQITQNYRKDYDSTSMSELGKIISKSDKAEVPLDVIKDLKSYAVKNNLKEFQVMKNLISVKVLYNKNLSYSEKKLFLEWAIQLYSSENMMIPVSYFTEALKKLKTQ
jgi:hypothetical protein